jgi:hypothetical protein
MSGKTPSLKLCSLTASIKLGFQFERKAPNFIILFGLNPLKREIVFAAASVNNDAVPGVGLA